MVQANNTQLKETTLTVLGMSCNHCKMTVESALNKTPGVNEATVDLAAKNVTIHYDPSAASEDQLANIIEKAGYEVKR